MGVMDRIWDEVFAGPRPSSLTSGPSSGALGAACALPSSPPLGGTCAPSSSAAAFGKSASTSATSRMSPGFSPSFMGSFHAGLSPSPSPSPRFHPSLSVSSISSGDKGGAEVARGDAGKASGSGGGAFSRERAMNSLPTDSPAGGGGGASAPWKLRSGLSIELPSTSRGALGMDCTDALLTPSSTLSPLPNIFEAGDRRASTNFEESQSVGGGSAQGMQICRVRRSSLDSARSLPTGFGFPPDILSPGARGKDPRGDTSLRPSVSEPPSATKPPVEARGPARVEGRGRGRAKAAVYDWYNPL